MKKVIQEKNESFVRVSNVRTGKYYGFGPINRDRKGFITQKSYRDGEFVAVSGEGLTYGNCWSSIDSSTSLEQYIKNLLAKGFEVFEFNTPKELFAWLAE